MLRTDILWWYRLNGRSEKKRIFIVFTRMAWLSVKYLELLKQRMKMSRRKQARPSRHLDDEEDQESALDLQINQISDRGKCKFLLNSLPPLPLPTRLQIDQTKKKEKIAQIFNFPFLPFTVHNKKKVFPRRFYKGRRRKKIIFVLQ